LVIGHSAGLVETIDPFIEYRLIIIGTSSKQQDKKYPKRTNHFNYHDIPFILKIDNYYYTMKPSFYPYLWLTVLPNLIGSLPHIFNLKTPFEGCTH
jgi:hypothetical protein